MEIVISFILGLVVGFCIMFFVYRNNNKKFTEYVDEKEKEIESLKKKFDIIRGK